MRKIERDMWAAVCNRKDWKSRNTAVYIEYAGNPHGPRAEVYLHGNHIADYWYQDQSLDVDVRTLARWPTPTTKSRLRALGADVETRKGQTLLNGEPLTC